MRKLRQVVKKARFICLIIVEAEIVSLGSKTIHSVHANKNLVGIVLLFKIGHLFTLVPKNLE